MGPGSENGDEYPFFEPVNRRSFKGVPYNKDASAQSQKIFSQMLRRSGVSPELADEVESQIKEATEMEKTNVVFIFTEGNYAVTVVHVPDSALNGEPGPVLMRGATEKHVIAAYSIDVIKQKLEDVAPEGAGLTSARTEELWVDELEKMAAEIRLELEMNPPKNWTSELDSGQMGGL